MLGILTYRSSKTWFSFLREPIEIYADGLVLPQSAFSSDFLIFMSEMRQPDQVIQLFNPESFDTLYLIVFQYGD